MPAQYLEKGVTLQVVPPHFPERPQAPTGPFTVKTTTHPRLICTEAERQAIMQRCNTHCPAWGIDYAAALAALLTNANTLLQAQDFSCKYYGDFVVHYPLPPRQPEPRENPPGFNVGRYPYWTMMGGQIKARLETLTLAYALSGRESYAITAKRDLLALTEWSVWSDPTYNCGGLTCLDTGYIVEGAATAYDLLYAFLSEPERARIRQALLVKGLQPLYADTDKRIDHNIHMVRTAALGYGALALLGEEPGMDAFIARACENFHWYLDQRLDSGQMEGLMYTSVSMDHIAGFAEALERVTGVDSMFRHPFVHDVLPRWVIYFQGLRGSGLVNFSDGSLANYFFRTMAAIGRVNKNAQANWYVASPKVGGAQAKLLHLDPGATVESPEKWPDSAVFGEIGWAALRSGWGASDTLLAFLSSGSHLGHNHFDQNHFTLNVAGAWLLTDPGYQDYQPGPKHDVTCGTIGHNALLVNGQGQSVRGGGRICSAFLSPVVDYVAGDATPSYKGKIGSWVRRIFFLKPYCFLMIDLLQREQSADRLELLLHPGGSVDAAGEELGAGYHGDAQPFVIVQDQVHVGVQVVWPPHVQMSVQEVPGAEVYGKYISLQPQLEGDNVVVATLLRPGVDAEGGQSAKVPAKVLFADEDQAALRLTVEVADVTYHVFSRKDAAAKDAAAHGPGTPVGSMAKFGDDVDTDGLHAVVCTSADGTLIQYALLGGRQLTWRNQVLVNSPVELSGAVYTEKGVWKTQYAAAADASVTLWVPGTSVTSGKSVAVAAVAGHNMRVKI